MPTRRSYLNVYQDGRRRLEKHTSITNFNAQGTAKGFLDIMALEMEKLYDNLEFIYNAIDPTKAVGSDLDKIGFLVGESRQSAVTASDYSNTNFYFYIDSRLNWDIHTLITNNYNAAERTVLENAGYITTNRGTVTSIIIPLGHIIGNSNQSVTYTTTEAATMTSREVYVGVVAAGQGSGYNVQTNALITHSISSIPELRRVAGFIKCTNRYPIQNGKYSATDDEFRYSIATARTALPTNELAIRRAALSVPGVRDILFEKSKYGNGTVSILVDGVSPIIAQGLINTVQEKIRQEMSYGDVIFVNSPTYLGVALSFNIIPSATATDIMGLRNAARDRVIQYINDLPIGGEIVWNRIVSLVLEIDGIDDMVSNYFKVGEYDAFYKVNRKEVVLRNINQKCAYNERFYTDQGLVTACCEQ